MPFTVSHIAAILPIHHIHRRTLLFAPLAIGSMAPDIPYFIDYSFAKNHEWSAVLPFYLPLGLAISLLWYIVLRRPAYQLLPYFFDAKNPLFQQDSILNHLWRLSWTAACIVIGTATHLIWDGLTHDDHRTFILKQTLATTIALGHFEMPLYRVLQYGSSGFGLLALVVYLWMRFKRRAVPNLVYPIFPIAYVMGLFMLFSLCGSYYAIKYFTHYSPIYLHSNNYYLIGNMLVSFIQGFASSFILYALTWQLWRLLRWINA